MCATGAMRLWSAKHTTPLNQQNALLLFQTAIALLSKSGAGAANLKSKDTAAAGLEALIINPTPNPKIGIWGGTLILSLPDLPASVTFSGALQGKVHTVDPTGQLAKSGFSTENTCAAATNAQASSGTTDGITE